MKYQVGAAINPLVRTVVYDILLAVVDLGIKYSA